MLRTPRYPSAVVIGAGAGIGRALALGLAAKGYIVFGTARSTTEVSDLKAASGRRVGLAVCDLARGESIKAWAEGVSDALGDAGLNVLFTNGGRSILGPLEVLPIEEIRREFEVNVFGVISMIGAFVPALRKAHGRIVQITDWTAAIALPFDGPSAASQAAMEAIAMVYRAELRPFGIDVVIASGGIETSMGVADTATKVEKTKATMTRVHRKLYKRPFDVVGKALASMQDTDADPSVAVSRLIALAEERPPAICGAITHSAEKIFHAIHPKSEFEIEALRRDFAGFVQTDSYRLPHPTDRA
ncbi:SDR family NAD(P)-dependent oxidoreductase [Rhizobium sp. AN80A]|uniref:SDR family NAD(P)-dependent oxidoreductase n=1 Tax=Rhizobium sp. AN80A TaxID=3040673 RepID=UPI0024B38DE1|nr:SDR family NAD(P)-dependent oxidoreductase [Rhizobium sp. AN80A]